jgi:hypothetical protein
MIVSGARRSSPRAGFGLFELLIAMFVFSAVLALFVAFLEVLLKTGSGGADHLDRLVSTGRLARSLRHDAHAARSVELPAAAAGAPSVRPGSMLRLRLDDNRWVEYAAERDLVRRTVYDGDSTTQTDEYPLEKNNGVWSINQAQGATLIGLRLERRLSPRRKSDPRPLTVEAIVGSDYRFDTGGRP